MVTVVPKPAAAAGRAGRSAWSARRRPVLPVIAAVLAVLAAGVLLAVTRSGWLLAAGGAPRALDDFGAAPAFGLTDQLERPVSSDALRGTVVVADFVYTTCQESCPLLSARMAALQARLRQERLLGTRATLLSFSVDPAHDTPPVLRAYAEQYQADPDAWRFLTGPEKYVLPLLIQGFHLGVQQVPLRGATAAPGSAADPGYDTMHSNRFVLIDREGHIRAYYDGLALDLDRVVADVRYLVQ